MIVYCITNQVDRKDSALLVFILLERIYLFYFLKLAFFANQLVNYQLCGIFDSTKLIVHNAIFPPAVSMKIVYVKSFLGCTILAKRREDFHIKVKISMFLEITFFVITKGCYNPMTLQSNVDNASDVTTQQ